MKKSYIFILILIIFLFGVLGYVVYMKGRLSHPPKDYKTYLLDTSEVTSREFSEPIKGTLIISHNAIAVFPLDLENQNRKLKEISSTTIFEAQTKSGCLGSGDQVLPESHEIVRNINASGPPKQKDVADITKISLEMPYEIFQDDYTRIPSTFCVGFHIKDVGWVWDFTPIEPVLDESKRVGVAEVLVFKNNVDVIAILFDSTTAIRKIQFDAAKIQ